MAARAHEPYCDRLLDRRALWRLALLSVLAYAPALIGLAFGAWPFDDDAQALFGPWREFTRQSLSRGVLPLWNPHTFCGLPFLANIQTSVLYPPNVVYWFFPLRAAFLLDAIAHNIMLACGAFALARALGQSRTAACVAAIALALSGAVSAHVYTGHGTWHAARAYIPWELWATLLYARSGRRFYALMLAALLTLQIAAGYPPFVLLGVALCCGLLLARSTTHALRFWRRARSRGGAQTSDKMTVPSRDVATWSGLPRGWMAHAAMVAALVATLSAVYVLPLREMSRLSTHGSSLNYADAVKVSGSWRSIARLLLPDFFGGNNLMQWSVRYGAWEEAAYGGLIVFVLAAGAPFFAARKQSRQQTGGAVSSSRFSAPRFSAPVAVWWLWPMLAVSLLLAMGGNTPVYRWLFEHVAPLRLTRAPVRWMEMWVLCAALLAGFSFDGLMMRRAASPHGASSDGALSDGAAGEPSAAKARVFQSAFIVLCAGLALLTLMVYRTAPGATLWTRTAQWAMTLPELDRERLRFAEQLREVALTQSAMAAITAAMMAALAARWQRAVNARDRRAQRLAQSLLVAAAVLDVTCLFWRSAKLVTPRRRAVQIVWPQPLTRHHSASQRWNTFIAMHAMNNHLRPGIDVFNGYDALIGNRYFDLANPATGSTGWEDLYQSPRWSPLLRVAGVTHTISLFAPPRVLGRLRRGRAEYGPADGDKTLAPVLVARRGEWRLWRHRGAWPRLYLSRRLLRRPDAEQIKLLSLLATQPFDARNGPVVVAPQAFADVRPGVLSPREGIKKWTRDLNTMTIWTRAAQPSVLVQSEALYPGWRAWVNGQAAALEPANYLFRAVAVPAGASRVAVVYDSQTFRFAGFVSLCGLGFVAAMAAHRAARRNG